MSELPILIIGGAGKTGARVDAPLQSRGMPTRPVSRSTPVPFDWTRPETWPAALAGVSMAYVTFQPDLAVEGAAEAIAEVGRLARENGLDRVVLLSGRGEPGAQRAEAALQKSGVPWTGVPEDVIQLLLELFTVVLDGRNSDVTHGVEQALGRPARDFSDYARRTAATGVWRA